MSDPFDSSGNNGGQPTPPPFGAPPSPPSGQPFLPPTQPVYSNPEQTPVYGDTNVTDLVEGSTPPKRSRGKMVGALVGVAALLAAGVFAITQIGDDDSSAGGAGSPEEVGENLVKSLDGEDLLGVVDLLLPGERDTFRQPLVDLNKELQRLEVTDGEVDLNKFPGLEITITDSKVRERPTNVDDISSVFITADVEVTVNGEDLPMGDFLIESAFGGERPDADGTEDEELDVELTTVKQGDSWYLSVLYTAARGIVGDEDIPEEGVVPVGADSPEGALENLITASADLNLERIIAGLNPNEVSALQRYAPLFLDDAQNDLDDVEAVIEVSGPVFTVSGSGDRRQVSLSAITVEATQGDEKVTLELKDGCATVSSGGESFATCSGETGGDDALDEALGQLDLPDTPEIMTFFEDLTEALSDVDMRGIVVDKVDGKWFVSPIGTGAEFILSIIRALDRDEIETIANDAGPALESFLDVVFGGPFDEAFPPDDTTLDTIPDDTSFDTIPDDTSFDTIPDDTTFDTFPDDTADDTTFDTFPDDSTFDTIDLETTTEYFDCLYSPGVEASECIQNGISDGRFNRDDIPGPYQFPDCGLFDYYYDGDIYSDSPADFHAVVDPAVQCIVDAAASAGADLTYSSPEFSHPECFVDVNPYNYSGDDTDAIGDAYDCAFEAS